MADNEVDIELVIKKQIAAAQLRDVKRDLETLLDGIGQGATRNRPKVRTISDEFKTIGVNIGRATVGMIGFQSAAAGIQTIIQAVRRELEIIKELQTTATEKTVPYGDRIADIGLTLPATSDISLEEINKRILASKVGNKNAMAEAVKSSINAGLALPVSERVDTALEVGEAFPFYARSDEETFKSLVEAVVQTKGMFGGSTQQQAGMLLAGASAARSTDMEMFAKNLSGIQVSLEPRGYTQEESLALVAAMGTRMVDPEGTTTFTNTLKLTEQLEEQFAKRRQKYPQLRGMRGGDQMAFMATDDPIAQDIRAELLGVMMQGATSEQERRDLRLIAQGKFEGKAKGKHAGMEFIQPPGSTADKPGGVRYLYRQALEEIPDDLNAAGKLYADKKSLLEGTSILDPGRTATSSESLINQFDIDSGRAQKAEILELMEKVNSRRAWGSIIPGSAVYAGMEGYVRRWASEYVDNEELANSQIKKVENQMRSLELWELHSMSWFPGSVVGQPSGRIPKPGPITSPNRFNQAEADYGEKWLDENQDFLIQNMGEKNADVYEMLRSTREILIQIRDQSGPNAQPSKVEIVGGDTNEPPGANVLNRD